VQSQPGEGATFEVYLPVTDRRIPSPVAPGQNGDSGTETILLIDDEERILDVVEKMLQLNGYTVIKACSGEEGVAIARAYPEIIHLIVLDMCMPVMGGPEAFPILQELRPSAKVLICSGYAIDEDSQSMLDAGAAGYVKKPFKLQELVGKVRGALSHNVDA
jgi:two-component system, cell cycle sensor histidine kinase and response regulator CckA